MSAGGFVQFVIQGVGVASLAIALASSASLVFAQEALYRPSADAAAISFAEAREVFFECKRRERRALGWTELVKLDISDDGYQLVFADGKSTNWLDFHRLSSPFVTKTGRGSDERLVVRAAGNTNPGSSTVLLPTDATLEDAKRCANALQALSQGMARDLPEQTAAFAQEAKKYREAATKPQITEEGRRLKVLAELAIREKRFREAADRYTDALKLHPWWPDGHFNQALVFAELGLHGAAARSMKRYLELVPEASDARAAQDKIYEWQSKSKRGG